MIVPLQVEGNISIRPKLYVATNGKLVFSRIACSSYVSPELAIANDGPQVSTRALPASVCRAGSEA